GVVFKGPQAPCTAPPGLPGLSVAATPKGALFNAQQLVTVAANDPAASIFYTTDGSDPTDPANPARVTYTIPIAIFAPDASPLTLKAAGVKIDPTGATPPQISPIITEVYRFDTVSPTVTASPIGGFLKTVQPVTLTASE